MHLSLFKINRLVRTDFLQLFTWENKKKQYRQAAKKNPVYMNKGRLRRTILFVFLVLTLIDEKVLPAMVHK